MKKTLTINIDSSELDSISILLDYINDCHDLMSFQHFFGNIESSVSYEDLLVSVESVLEKLQEASYDC